MNTISDRLRCLVELKTDSTRRHKGMEQATGLPADLWKAWWHGKQRPNAEMIQSVAQVWPEFAFWLVTGVSDAMHGHIMPKREHQSQDWGYAYYLDQEEPTNRVPELKLRLRSAARDYFMKLIEFQRVCGEKPIIYDRDNIEIQMEITGLSDELVSLSAIRREQEETLKRIEQAGGEKFARDRREFDRRLDDM